LALFESGAILLYLADKTDQFISADPNTRYETIQWLMWQMGGVGPMFGQVGFFNKFAGKAYEDKRPRDRYATESARLLGVLDERLAGRDWVMGADYSIADISLLGWVRNLIGFYEARELVEFDRYGNVAAWLERGLARPAVIAKSVPACNTAPSTTSVDLGSSRRLTIGTCWKYPLSPAGVSPASRNWLAMNLAARIEPRVPVPRPSMESWASVESTNLTRSGVTVAGLACA